MHVLEDRFSHKLGFPQLVGPATTHVNGWWKRSSIFLKQNAHQRRSTVLYNSTFFRFTRPIRYLWHWRTRWKDSTFYS